MKLLITVKGHNCIQSGDNKKHPPHTDTVVFYQFFGIYTGYAHLWKHDFTPGDRCHHDANMLVVSSIRY